MLLDHAPGLDTARFRQFAEEVAYRADPDAADEREQRRWDKRHLSFGLTLDATGMLSGTCGDAVSYEILRTAAEAFSPPGGQGDGRTAAQRRMDGLVAACKAALDAGAAPERHGAAPHITVLVKDETLAQAARAAYAAGATADPGHAAGPGRGPGQSGVALSGQATRSPAGAQTAQDTGSARPPAEGRRGWSAGRHPARRGTARS